MSTQLSSSNSIYSNAFNFSSFLHGGVDVRTGQYTVNIQLANVQSHYLNGPAYNLTLSHSPITSGENDSGFGIGWNLAGSVYDKRDRNNKKLTVASGERFLVDYETATEVTFIDKKLNNFTIEKVGQKYLIVYKNGTKELLAASVAVPNLYVLEKSISATGLELTFEYDYPTNAQPRLISIKEGQEALVKLAYNAHIGVQIKKVSGNQALITTTLALSNDRLYFISLPNNPNLGYTISYNSSAANYISQLVHPTGATEYINYKLRGHQLPPGAFLNYVPYVISHRLVPGDQPEILKTYQYSDYNFLGFGALTSWDSSRDNLYRVDNAYRYWGKETANNCQTTKTYNNFHLVLSEKVAVNDNNVITSIEYPIKPGVYFAEQPPQFQLPTSHTVEYKNTTGSRTVTTLTEYDEWGNLLSKTDPSGLKIQYIYYAKEGETGCPPDPDGFVRHVKCQTTIPHTPDPSEPSKTVTSTYQLMKRLNNHGQFIVPSTETSHAGLTRTFHYHADTSQEVAYGKVKKITETLHEKNTVKSFTYQAEPDAVTEIEQTTGHDNKTCSLHTKLCKWTRNMLAATDKDGVENRFQYDALNRILVATAAPDTSYEATKTFAYSMGLNTNHLTITNVKGEQKRILYDNAGRETGEALWDAHNKLWRTTKQRQYNNKGQVTQETLTDWYQNTPTALKKTYAYNDWEELAKTTYPDGHVEVSEVDPIANTKRTGIQGLGLLETKYNAVHLEIEYRKLFPNAPADNYYATATKTYDGYHRLKSQTDFMNNATNIYSDKFDRCYRLEAPEGLSTVQSFLPYRPENLVQQIKAGKVGQEIELGTRNYDGLGRVVAETKNNLTTQYQYGTSQLHYDSLITPQGDKLQVNYNKQLRAIESKTIGNSTDTYTYDLKSGLNLTNANAQAQNSFVYNTRGQLLTQSTANKAFTIDYSLLGRPHAQTDYFGNTAAITYNTDGSVAAINYSQSTAAFTYDAYGRLTQYQYSSAANAQLKISLTLDDFNRETKRMIQLSTGQRLTIEQAYNKNDKLTTRIRTLAGTETLKETFAYDGLGRLTNYQCTGSAAPKDEYGLTLQAESYTFNETMSLKTVTRQFTNGKTNICTFEYAPDNPVRAIRVTNSLTDIYPASVALTYDENGNLTSNTQGRKMAYSALNQLTSVVGQDQQSQHYCYDAAGKLRAIKANQEATQLWYNADQLVAESNDKQSTVYNYAQGHPVGGITVANDTKTLWMVGADAKGSPMLYAADPATSTVAKQYTYTPYGHRSEVQAQPSEEQRNNAQDTTVGFNAERLDEKAGLYHLGNGYRAYDPLMMCFYSPDSLSPFDKAGINLFGYCNGDPINFLDPSGHIPDWLNLTLNVLGLGASLIVLGISIAALIPTGGASSATAGLSAMAVAGFAGASLGVISGTLGVASAAIPIEDKKHGWDRSEISRNLGIASIAFGAAAFFVGGITAIKSAGQAFSTGLTVSYNTGEASLAAISNSRRLAFNTLDVGSRLAWQQALRGREISTISKTGYFRAAVESISKGLLNFIGFDEAAITAVTPVTKFIGIASSIAGGADTAFSTINLTLGSISEHQARQADTAAISEHQSGHPSTAVTGAHASSNPTITVGNRHISSKVIQLHTQHDDIAPQKIRNLS